MAWTLSQTGMVVHWRRERSKGWKLKALLNATGALATGAAFSIVWASKFLDGSWIAVLLIPILVALFLQVRGRQKEIEGAYEPLSPIDLNSNFGYESGMER